MGEYIDALKDISAIELGFIVARGAGNNRRGAGLRSCIGGGQGIAIICERD